MSQLPTTHPLMDPSLGRLIKISIKVYSIAYTTFGQRTYIIDVMFCKCFFLSFLRSLSMEAKRNLKCTYFLAKVRGQRTSPADSFTGKRRPNWYGTRDFWTRLAMTPIPGSTNHQTLLRATRRSPARLNSTISSPSRHPPQCAYTVRNISLLTFRNNLTCKNY